MATLLPHTVYSLEQKPQLHTTTYNHRLFRISAQSRETIQTTIAPISRVEYTPGVFDNVFLNVFRNKMAQEVGWDSEKVGYDGLIDVANRLMVARTNAETKDAAVRILRSLFPPLLLELYKILIAPIAQGKVAAVMVDVKRDVCFVGITMFPSTKLVNLCSLEARVTALSCQWLMGTCTVNNVDLPDGSSIPSGVFVERCKYLEESKCVGICVNTCKLPTQEFFMDHMGVPLLMEPNFTDYSCQFKFGVTPPEEDSILKEPCLEVCPNATRRQIAVADTLEMKCPKA